MTIDSGLEKLLNISAWSYLTPENVFPRSALIKSTLSGCRVSECLHDNFFMRRRDFRRYVGIPPEEIDIDSIWDEKAVQNLVNPKRNT